MANLKEIRNRISSVSSTKQITSAMKMVSAAKLRKSQGAIVQLRPYAQLMNEVVCRLTDSNIEDITYLKEKKIEKKVLLIPLTSNKGLCSTFNSSIIKLTKLRINKHLAEGKEVYLQSFGKKGDSAFKYIQDINYLGSNDEIWECLNFENISLLADNLLQEYAKGTYDRVEIIYNQFKNAAVQEPKIDSFLPFDLTTIKTTDKSNNNYIFEPSKTEILQNIISLILQKITTIMKNKIYTLFVILIFPLLSLAQVKINMEKDGGVYVVPCKVNGLPLKFIFDTGASDVVISYSEAIFMLKNGYLKAEDIKGTSYSQIANGDIVENTNIILREIEIGGMKIYNISGSISHSLEAPLLLGQSALQKLGTVQVKGNILTIMNAQNSKFDYTGLKPNVYKKNEIVFNDGNNGKYIHEYNDGKITIHTIAITQQYTILELTYRNKYNNSINIDKNAAITYYKDKNEKLKFVRIIKAENIAFSPNTTTLKNGVISFRLYFPKIPTSSISSISFFNTDESDLNFSIWRCL